MTLPECLASDHYVTFWTAINALVTGGSMIAVIYTVFLTRKTIRLTSDATQDSLKSFRTTLETANYSELDNMYFELLKVALEKPYLTQPDALTSDRQKQEYDIYAYMIWNFLEAIHDRCHGDKELEETWYPVIDAENRLHRKWFDDARNVHKFKHRFKHFIAGTNTGAGSSLPSHQKPNEIGNGGRRRIHANARWLQNLHMG